MLRKALACGAVVCFVTCFAALSSAHGASLAKGKQIFSSRCVLCHGVKGNGQGPAGMALNPHPADFASAAFWKAPNIEKTMADVIKNGKGAMPSFSTLSESDIQSVIKYIAHTFKPK